MIDIKERVAREDKKGIVERIREDKKRTVTMERKQQLIDKKQNSGDIKMLKNKPSTKRMSECNMPQSPSITSFFAKKQVKREVEDSKKGSVRVSIYDISQEQQDDILSSPSVEIVHSLYGEFDVLLYGRLMQSNYQTCWAISKSLPIVNFNSIKSDLPQNLVSQEQLALHRQDIQLDTRIAIFSGYMFYVQPDTHDSEYGRLIQSFGGSLLPEDRMRSADLLITRLVDSQKQTGHSKRRDM